MVKRQTKASASGASFTQLATTRRYTPVSKASYQADVRAGKVGPTAGRSTRGTSYSSVLQSAGPTYQELALRTPTQNYPTPTSSTHYENESRNQFIVTDDTAELYGVPSGTVLTQGLGVGPMEIGAAAPITAEDVLTVTPGKAVAAGGMILTKPAFIKLSRKFSQEAAERVAKQTAGGTIDKAAAGIIEKKMKESGQVPINTKTAKTTKEMFSKILMNAKETLISPGGLLAILGSYPFAMFIKQEALQTTGFAQKQAKDSKDLDALKRANDYNEHLHNPEVWHQLISLVPFINTAQALIDYFKASQLSNAGYRDREDELRRDLEIERLVQEGTATVEDVNEYVERNPFSELAERMKEAAKRVERLSDEEYFSKIEEEKQKAKEAERKADEEYYERLRKEAEAREKAQREEQEAYYAGIEAERLKRKAAERKADEYYYAKRAGIQTGSGQQEVSLEKQSSLNFGLLRTPGGYEMVNRDDYEGEGEFINTREEIAQLLFGVGYGELTDIQRQNVDLYISG